jgi:hypothetical protein
MLFSNFTRLALTSGFLLRLGTADFRNRRDIEWLAECALIIHILNQF